jgi:hypothetical protein
MTRQNRWVELLSDEDLAFLKRFLLASGTLKEVASDYGISYPTVRLRLDRLIEKVKLFESAQPRSRLEAELVAAYAEGSIDEPIFRKLLTAFRTDQEELND